MNKHFKRVLLLGVFFCILVKPFAQGVLDIGDSVPFILSDTSISNTPLTPASFNGKVVVVDFWFTNCAPCVYTIPHLNDLAAEFKDQGVVFVAVTFEETARVRDFLSKKRISANVWIDSTYRLHRLFGVSSYPTTFVIDKAGVLRWKGYPGQLTSDMINFLLQRETYPEIGANAPALPATLSGELKAIEPYPIEIAENTYMDKGSGYQFTAREIGIINKPLTEIVSILKEISVSRIKFSFEDQKKYDLRFLVPDGIEGEQIKEEAFRSMLRELNLKAEWQQENKVVYRLELADGERFVSNTMDSAQLYSGFSKSEFRDYWVIKGATMAHLAGELERRFNVLIVDLTKLNGFYHFQLPVGDFEAGREKLFSKYGLKLTPANENVNLLYLRKDG